MEAVRLVMAQEVEALKPLLSEYYKEIEFKEAQQNLGVMFNQVALACANEFVFALFEEDQTYPLDMNQIPVGFIWFKINLDQFGKMYCHVEAAFIAKPYRSSGLFNKLMDLLSLHSRWYRVNYYTIDASTRKLHKAWSLMGFKDEHIHMVFRGGAKEFHAKGQNNNYWFDEEKEQVTNGKQVKTKKPKHKPSRSSSKPADR